MARALTTCAQCGQTDDHPKVIFAGGPDKHHDCLSVSEKQQVVDSSDVAAKIVEACEKGKRGDALLAHIESLHAKGK